MSAARLALALGALSVLLSSRAVADEQDVRWLREPFRVHAGDDPSWSSPGLDDAGWPAIDSRLLAGNTPPGWSGIGWFRVWVDVSPELARAPVALHGRYVGAAEVFVDGTRQLAIGDPGAVAGTGSTPVDFRGERPRWLAFSGPGRHLLAVRFASRHVAAMHRIGFPAGFELGIAPAASRPPAPGSRRLDQAFVGATTALGLLHLLLFAFHRDRRANLYYALASLGVAGIAGCQQALGGARSATEVMLWTGGFGAGIALSSLLLLRFYHAVFSPRLPRTYWILFAIGWGLALTAWTAPRAGYYGFAVLVSIAQAWVLVRAVVRRVSGAWIIGVGGALWVLGATLQMLGDLRVLPVLEDAYLYGFFALLASISVYLARDIARDKGDLARKLVEIEELSEKERRAMERYRTIFETTGTGTIIFGTDGVISLANQEWARLTGYARDEIEGRMTWTTFFGAEPGDAPRTEEARLRDRRGRLRDGAVTISQVPGTGERVGSFLDLTDLKRAQQQMVRADKMAALGQIVAGVAHEINNPNNFIHFNLPILRRYVEAMRPLLEVQLDAEPDLTLCGMRYEAFLEDLFKLLENMEHGSQRITAIVSDLKGYVRGGEDVVMTPGSIARVIEQVMVLVGKQVQKMVQRLEVDVAAELPLVKMNAGKIEQVLINLLINAGQAADKESSFIKLGARAADTGRAVEIRVEDNGTGIPREHLEQVFEPFFTSKGRETGTGLGLSISQQIIEEHGGRIEVESEPGQGTTFTLRLPAVA